MKDQTQLRQEQESDLTQIIKRSICFRAKYRVREKKRKILPWLVVPHPKNRGGDPIKSIRTKQLTGTIAVDGYDPVEANSNGVVLQEKPVVTGKTVLLEIGKRRSYQQIFAGKLNCDPEIAEKDVSGLEAKFASLSHGHLNCTFRNIQAGKRGCECIEEPAVAGPAKKRKICSCKNKPIVDEDGNYCMQMLQNHDPDWHRDCLTGVEFEELAYTMDEEEPTAAEMICISLNKKNETAMKTGHLEIMSTLAAHCTPDPRSGAVPYQPVLDQLITRYGSQVDHPDFHYAFRYVITAGGADSRHISDMTNFTTVFVNEKVRKMRFEVYGIIAPYPVKYVKLKNACLKWAWRQPTRHGWCQMPTCINHRLVEGSKFEWCEVMEDLEHALTVISSFASLVVKQSAVAEQGRLKAYVKWSADVEILLVSALFAFPRCTVKEDHTKQRTKVAEKCAEVIATQVLELLKLGPHTGDRSLLPSLDASNSEILTLVTAHIADMGFPGGPAAVPASVITVLTPTVAELDSSGRVVSELATVSRVTNMVPTEDVPWDRWVELETCPDAAQDIMGKNLLEMTIRGMHCHVMKPFLPIALARKGKEMKAVTTQAVGIGDLIVPLFFRRHQSMVMEHEPGVRSPKGVTCNVEWAMTPTALEVSKGLETKEIALKVFISPELKLPKAKCTDLEWTKTEDVHPFWFIKRSCKADVVKNMEVVYESVQHLITAPFKHLNEKLQKKVVVPQTDTYWVSYPCLVNTVPILAGQELVLDWKPALPVGKDDKVQPDKNAFDQIAQADKKLRKAKAKAT